jgi:hypothetical protein
MKRKLYTLTELLKIHGINCCVLRDSWFKGASYLILVGIYKDTAITVDSRNGEYSGYQADKKNWYLYKEPKKKTKVYLWLMQDENLNYCQSYYYASTKKGIEYLEPSSLKAIRKVKGSEEPVDLKSKEDE